ncbi:hypothetical protein [Legionella brunensis]|uniref:Uncharacterized protein n=1 Tax=Legionella brunensis TaxID=29422 RepID=A0A0W0SMN2_9GAMM|nr:hypothetical protein [Legionella brunensis]KTC84513.1 hypothetical protein Lbru_1381 [Legionella brunensis]
MNTLINDLVHFDAYLRGGDPKELKAHLQYYNQHLNQLRTNYHETIINSDPELTNKVKIILQDLCIPSESWTEYLNLTTYNLLLRLNREQHPQISYLLEIIDKKTAPSKLKLLIGGSSVVVLLLSLLTLPYFAPLVESIDGLLTSVIGLPILGLGYTVLRTFFYFYQNHVDAKKTLIERMRDNAFLIANTLLNIAAYSFWIQAAAPMTPLVAGLFVIASAVDVVKEIVSLVHDHIRFRHHSIIDASSPLLAQQAYIRQLYGFSRHKNALFINLGTSIILLGIMAAWCFVPGGLVVTLCSLAAIMLVSGLKHWLVKFNEEKTRSQLQTALREKEIEYQRSHEPQLEVSQALSQLVTQTDIDNQASKNNPTQPISTHSLAIFLPVTERKNFNSPPPPASTEMPNLSLP